MSLYIKPCFLNRGRIDDYHRAVRHSKVILPPEWKLIIIKYKMIKSDSKLNFLNEVEAVVNYSIMVLPT